MELNHSARLMRVSLLILLIAGTAVSLSACTTEETDRERRDRERQERIEERVERAVERAEERVAAAQERIEERLDERVSEEDRERIRRDVERSVKSSLEGLGAALEGIGEALQADADVETVDWRDLKDLVPRDLADYERLSWDGENKGAFGIRISKIEARYTSNGTDLKLNIVDLGTIKGAAMKGFEFLDGEIDRENVNGIEATREWNGHPGYVSTDTGRSRDQAIGVAVVADRFIVTVELDGSNASVQELENVFDDFSFRRLTRMAD